MFSEKGETIGEDAANPSDGDCAIHPYKSSSVAKRLSRALLSASGRPSGQRREFNPTVEGGENGYLAGGVGLSPLSGRKYTDLQI